MLTETDLPASWSSQPAASIALRSRSTLWYSELQESSPNQVGIDAKAVRSWGGGRCYLGRRHRHLEHQPQQPRHAGLRNAEHRPHRWRGHQLYRL